MTKKRSIPGLVALRKLKPALSTHRHGRKARAHTLIRALPIKLWRRLHLILRNRPLRRWLIGSGAVVAILILICSGVWWRLGSGPIAFDVATPWLTSAIEDNFGESYKVQVGGTQIERDENGRMQLRLRDIAVRDAEGAVAASAPKAEVGFSLKSLFVGRMRAERLALVGAEMSVRIDQGGQVSVFAGSDKRPIATASVTAGIDAELPAPREAGPSAPQAEGAAQKGGTENLNALLTWIDKLGASGLDGHDLAELGLKSGSLIVDDQRNGKRWNFENIDLSLKRARGGVVFRLDSANEERPWSLAAAVSPLRAGRRTFSVEARRVMARDLLLALRLFDDPIMAEVPLSASLQAEIGTDGTMQAMQGRIIAGPGYLNEGADGSAMAIDRAEFTLEWDPARRVLAVPFQVIAGGNRFTLMAHVEPPRTASAPWNATLQGGTAVLGADKGVSPPVLFNAIRIRTRFDPQSRRLFIEQGDIANSNIRLLISGDADFSTGDPFLKFQIVASGMPVDALKKIWPSFVNAKVRNWTNDHVLRGDVERVAIATNAHLSAFKRGGPPVPDDGLFIEISARNVALRPLETLPPIEEAQLAVEVKGRHAAVAVNKGAVALASGRKLYIADGQFEVPDCEAPQPPTKTNMRIEGPVPSAAELLETDRLREFVNMPFDISSAKGNVFAQVSLAFPMKADLPPGSSIYSVKADIANFSVDKMIMGQKVEAQSLRITADNQGYEIKGDTRIAGAAALLNYSKSKTDEDARVSIQTTLDDNGRNRLGLESSNALTGPVPIKLNGYIGASDREMRLIIDADLTQARIDNLLPGWSKQGGSRAQARFALATRGPATRVEDLAIDGAGAQVKGSFELDGSNNVVSANFPVFRLSENDRSNSLKADRGPDGTLRVIMRGDVHDGRGFIKATLAGGRPDPKDKPPIDLDLDLKLGTVMGFNGETLRNLDLKLSRRSGHIQVFGMNAKLGGDAQLVGDMRRRQNSSSNVIYLATRDAGAFFRFTNAYSKMLGGTMTVVMDPPTAQAAPQEGGIWISDFTIRGEPALDRVSGAQPGTGGVRFDRMKAEFTRSPGRLEIRDGVVHGSIGATIDGLINYAGDEVHLRGSFVPLSPLNNLPGQIPLIGLFLGGGNEGLVGVTYEVKGSPGAPRLNVNPLSPLAPGIFRKLFEFRDAPAAERGYEPVR